MSVGGRTSRVAAACVVLAFAAPVSAQESVSAPPSAKEPLLLAPVQGSDALRTQHADRVESAVRRALLARGYGVTVAQESLGQAVVACQTPECVEQALDAAEVAFAIVPAIWSRESGGEELTLTLLERSRRSLNASEVVGDDLSVTAADVVDELLAQQAMAAPLPLRETALAPDTGPTPTTARPHAWKAGPIILITGGAAAFVAIGVAAGVKKDSQQLDGAAVAVWSTIGTAAIAGGIAWWVVGEKQRRKRSNSASTPSPAVCLRPTGFDLKLWF
jgi:hypothetical protein